MDKSREWKDRSRDELIRELENIKQEMRDAGDKEAPGPSHFRAFFEESFVPFWLEDWSFAGEYVQGLFDSGVEDLQGYFSDHPESLASCMDMVRLVDANRATLDFFGLSQKAQMLSEWDKRVTPWARRTFVQALWAFIREGKSSFRSESALLDAAGDLRRLIVNFKVPALHRETLEQVHITATDITEMRAAQASLEKGREFERLIARLAGAFVFPENLEGAIEEALAALGRLSRASRAYLILFDEGYERISGYIEWCAEGIPSSRQHVIQALLDQREWYLSRLMEDKEILVDDVGNLPPEAGSEKAQFESQGIRSLAAIPVFVGERLEGAVGFDNVENTQRWGETALTQLRLFCGILGSSLHGMRKSEEVQAQKRKLDAIFHAAEDVGFVTADVTTPDFRVTGFSPGAEKIFGYSEEEALGRPIASLHLPQDVGRFSEIKRELSEGSGRFRWDLTLVRKNGIPFPALLSLHPLKGDEGSGLREVLGVILDLSSLRTAEEALTESRERLKLALDAISEGIWDWHIDEDIVFLSPGWFEMVGIVEKEESMSFSRWVDYIHKEDSKVFQEKLNAHLSGETSLFEVPLRLETDEGRWRWVLSRGRVVRRAPSGKALRVVGTQVDISELKAVQDKLEAANESITATLARIVEARDVYTAGHQVRTSRLAESIAREMGLPDEEVHLIRTAAILHDIGKIVIPTEILNKPGPLSSLELNLIRIHPEEGASLLGKVPFPPEVVEIVRQHHERWDGSGYPQGLKKKKSLRGSRILAVADVVETMASHRPYRPEKGLEAALREIGAQKNRLYDPEVVEACLRLFREKDYDLDEKE